MRARRALREVVLVHVRRLVEEEEIRVRGQRPQVRRAQALGGVAESAFFGALARDHAFGTGSSAGAAGGGAILRKHALDAKFDSAAFADCSAKKSRSADA